MSNLEIAEQKEPNQEFTSADCDKAISALEEVEKSLGPTDKDKWEQVLDSKTLNTIGKAAFKPFELPALAIIGLMRGGNFKNAKKFIEDFKKEMFSVSQ